MALNRLTILLSFFPTIFIFLIGLFGYITTALPVHGFLTGIVIALISALSISILVLAIPNVIVLGILTLIFQFWKTNPFGKGWPAIILGIFLLVVNVLVAFIISRAGVGIQNL